MADCADFFASILLFQNLRYLCTPQVNEGYAEVAQLVEHNLAKVGVAGSSLVFRSKEKDLIV